MRPCQKEIGITWRDWLGIGAAMFWTALNCLISLAIWIQGLLDALLVVCVTEGSLLNWSNAFCRD
jgi:hypothetical protein